MCPKPPQAWAAGRAAAAARAADDSFMAGVGEYTALSRCLVQAPVCGRVVMLRRDTARNDSKGTPKIPKRRMNGRQKVEGHSRHPQSQKSLAVDGEKGGRPQSHWPAPSTPLSLEARCWGNMPPLPADRRAGGWRLPHVTRVATPDSPGQPWLADTRPEGRLSRDLA